MYDTIVERFPSRSHLISQSAHLIDIISDAHVALLGGVQGDVRIDCTRTGLGTGGFLNGSPCSGRRFVG
jgi:hypothetical protein